jgi:hypothetical protein
MDRFFDRFLGLVEDAEADLPPAEYRQLMDDIHRVSLDKGAKPCPAPDTSRRASKSGNGTYRP